VAGQQLTFEGLQVLGHQLKLKGKVEAAGFDELHHGDEVFVLVRAKVTGVAFTDEEDYGAVVREHTCKVDEVYLLPESVSPAIVFQEAKSQVDRAREAARQPDGQQSLEDA
jgi:hypothetical protein